MIGLFQHIKTLTAIAVGFIMLNFSVYLAEIDLLQRITKSTNLIECVEDLMIQASAEEEGQQSDSSVEVDLFIAGLTSAQYSNSYFIIDPQIHSTSILVKLNVLGIETPPPEI